MCAVLAGAESAKELEYGSRCFLILTAAGRWELHLRMHANTYRNQSKCHWHLRVIITVCGWICTRYRYKDHRCESESSASELSAHNVDIGTVTIPL